MARSRLTDVNSGVRKQAEDVLAQTQKLMASLSSGPEAQGILESDAATTLELSADGDAMRAVSSAVCVKVLSSGPLRYTKL